MNEIIFLEKLTGTNIDKIQLSHCRILCQIYR